MSLSSIPWYNTLRYHVVPPVFLVLFTFLAQALAVYGNPESKVAVHMYLIQNACHNLTNIPCRFPFSISGRPLAGRLFFLSTLGHSYHLRFPRRHFRYYVVVQYHKFL